MIKTIFILTEYYYFGKLKYPKKLIDNIIGYYSDISAFKKFFIEYLFEGEVYKLSHYKLIEKKLNVTDFEDQSIRLFDKEKKLISAQYCSDNSPFRGRPAYSCLYPPGTIVEIIIDNIIEIGLIALLPMTQEKYKEIKDNYANNDNIRIADNLIKKSMNKTYVECCDNVYNVIVNKKDYSHDHLREIELLPLRSKVSKTKIDKLINIRDKR